MSTEHGSSSRRGLFAAAIAAGIVAFVALVVVATSSAVARVALAADDHRALEPVWTHFMHDGPWGMATDRAGIVVTTDMDDVQSLDRGGHLRWSAHLESIVKGAPAIDDTHVIVGGRGLVTAVARHDGNRRWSQPMDADVTSVAIAGGLVLVGDHAGTLAAFDAETGVLRWSVHYEGRLWSAARVDPATGTVVATWHWSATPAVRAFELATGALRWQAPTEGFTAAPVIEHGLVVVAVGDGKRNARVEARDLVTGERRWDAGVPGSFEEAIEPVADAHDVAVVDHLGVATLLDLATGTVRWQHDFECPLLESRVALTDRRVVFKSFSGDIFVLSRATGRLVSQQSPQRLGGYPIAAEATSWRGHPRLLVALRLGAPYRVELLPLP
ncbi:MAG: PQQ-binding-like beta-propeller repeat protein [Acidimicrobiia bacterium]